MGKLLTRYRKIFGTSCRIQRRSSARLVEVLNLTAHRHRRQKTVQSLPVSRATMRWPIFVLRPYRAWKSFLSPGRCRTNQKKTLMNTTPINDDPPKALHMSDPTEQEIDFSTRFDKYLEVPVMGTQVSTHKQIGDNLRAYPVIAIFGVAVSYLWTFPGWGYYPSWMFKVAAVVWSAWVSWYSVLTVIQTHKLLSDSISRIAPEWINRHRLFRMVVVVTIEWFFILGAISIALLILSHGLPN